jgi:hypothetical protein
MGLGAGAGLLLFVAGNVLGARRGQRNEIARQAARATVLEQVPVDDEAGRVGDLRKGPYIRASTIDQARYQATIDQARYQHGPTGW